MNWLDIAIVIFTLFGCFRGLKSGLISATAIIIGVILGIILAGQFSDNVKPMLADTITSERLASVLSYALILSATVAASWVIGKFVKALNSLLFLGWADKFGGVALGFLAGILISGALIATMARLTYNFEIPDPVPHQQIVANVIPIESTQGFLENTLLESALVPRFVEIQQGVPESLKGSIPEDFRIALTHLQSKIEGKGP